MEQIDFLTGLNTMAFLTENYHHYLEQHVTTKMIAIDFAKLKYINDNFGHEVGDECLKTFALLAKENFDDALLIRRSGDEFLIVTKDTNETIEKKVEKIHDQIEGCHEKNMIPTTFSFNCGVKKCESNLKETMLKADATMYQAKSNGEKLRYYEEAIFIKLNESKEFIKNVDELNENKAFRYVYQRIFSLDKQICLIKEFYLRDNQLKSLFDKEHFRILEMNYRFKKIDLYSLETIFKEAKIENESEKIMINIHYQTLFSRELDILTTLEEWITKYNLNPESYILSINIRSIKEKIPELIEKIKEVRKLGFKICLDSLEHGGSIFQFLGDCPAEYLKIAKTFLKKSMYIERRAIILKKMMEALIKLDGLPIFSSIETVEEKEFISDLGINVLAKGNFFEKEQEYIKKA